MDMLAAALKLSAARHSWAVVPVEYTCKVLFGNLGA
jgi:hypothetical protein